VAESLKLTSSALLLQMLSSIEYALMDALTHSSVDFFQYQVLVENDHVRFMGIVSYWASDDYVYDSVSIHNYKLNAKANQLLYSLVFGDLTPATEFVEYGESIDEEDELERIYNKKQEPTLMDTSVSDSTPYA
jgi:hypothetical protein